MPLRMAMPIRATTSATVGTSLSALYLWQHRSSDRKRRAPMLLVGVGAEEDQPVFLADQRPAGAAAAAFGAGRGREIGGEDRPLKEPRQDPADGHDQGDRDEAVQPAREQVLARPSERAGFV